MNQEDLKQLYVREGKSVADIARYFKCSQHKINYWLSKHEIRKRSISEAIYLKANPQGDPFSFQSPRSTKEAFLFGLGIGLYWGEGNKRNVGTVRLGNTDPHLVKLFVLFLRKFYNIQDSRLRFGLQVFSDMNLKKEEKFWCDFLQVLPKQFYKTINTRSGSIGTYREKSVHGVLTVYFHNKKLRDLLVGEIEKLRTLR